MGFTPKDWINEADHAGPPASPPGTPISGASLEDLETRVTDYTDLLAGTTAGIFNVKDYGAETGIAASQTTEFQAAIDAAEAAKGVVYIPDGTYRLDTGITIDVALTGMVSHRAKLDFGNLASGVAITLTGSVSLPWTQSFTALEGLEIEGNSKTGTVVGVLLNTAAVASEGPSHVSCQNLNIHDFGYGVKFDDRAYLTTFYGCDVWSCTIGIETVADTTDGGERLAFYGCVIYSCLTAVQARNPNGTFHFTNCSFDYNYDGATGTTFTINGSQVLCTDCHLEFPNTVTGEQVTVTGDGGLFEWRGGHIVGGGESNALDYVFEATTGAGGSSGILIDGAMISGCATTSDFFAGGTGTFRMLNTQTHATNLNAPFTSAAMSLLRDGSFENYALTAGDNIFITQDSAAITDRTNGTNIDLAVSATYARTGSNSLKATKAGAAATSAGFAVAVPITSNGRPSAIVYYKKAGAQTGTMYIAYYVATLRHNSSAVPIFGAWDNYATDTIVFTSDAVDWTATGTGSSSKRLPPWATHFVLAVNLDSVGAGDLYFDDFVISET